MAKAVPLYVTLDEWIVHESISVTQDSSDTLNAAVDIVMASLDNSVEILGFGEALHGGEEILLLRNRIFKYLVEKHGFSAIAVESSFPRAYITNEFVAGRSSSSFKDIQDEGFSHGFGKLDANRELIEWMREYNADTSHRVKLRFYGFDSPSEMTGTDSPRQLLNFVLNYLTAMDNALGKEYRKRIEPHLGMDKDWENPAAMMDPTKSIGLSPEATALRLATEDLIEELQVLRPELVAKSNKSRFMEALQYAAVARQLLNYHAELARASNNRIAKLLGIRDSIMADNLVYTVSHEQGRGKVFAYAHNSHLKQGKAEWKWGSNLLSWWPAGAHLREIFGSRYAVIGSGVGISDANGIGKPEEGTLESKLTVLKDSVRFIPTHKGKSLTPSIISKLPTRTGSMKNQTYFPFTSQSFTDFDWLAVLDSTTYTRGGPKI